MKTKKGLWAVLGTVLGLALVAGVFLYLKTLHAQAQGDVVTDDTIPIEDNSKAKGSINNPFVILEIVSYLGYAELGYLIDGCEPVDVEELCRYPEKAAGVNLQAVTSFGGAGFTDKIFEDEGDVIGKPSDWILKEGIITLFGYYEYVGEGKGYLERNGSGYDSVGDGNGDIIWVTTAMSETREIKDRIKLNDRFSQAGDRLYGSRTADGYYTIDESNKHTRYQYVNYDDFIRNTIGVTEREKVKNYNIIVKTITPSELNAKKQWIDRADLISLSPKIHVTDGDKLWGMYNRGGLSPVSHPPENFYGNDLEWDTALRIFEKVNLEVDFAAIVVDWGIYTETLSSGNKKNVSYYVLDANGNKAKDSSGAEVKTPTEAACNNNIFKLLLIMKVMDPNAFYNYYLADMPDGSGPLINAAGEFRAQTGNARTYWNRFTFMPYVVSAGGTYENEWKNLSNTVLKADVLMGNNNSNVSVRGRMYTFNGNNPINQSFMSQKAGLLPLGTNQTDDYEKYLADHPELKNLPATAIRFILGLPPAEEQEVKPKLTILDVEPCNSFTMTERYFRLTYIPTYMGPIDFVRQNSQEFNGKIEDLNTKYDLIYLGINDGDLNKSGGKTVYNDTDLNGFIYLGIGDELYSSNWSSTGGANQYRGTNWISYKKNDGTQVDHTANTLANRELRLPGNDITKLRKGDLEGFLEAGYPVLAESELKNTSKVDSNTNIYKFVDNSTGASFILTNDSNAQTKVSTYILKNKPVIELSPDPDDNPRLYNGTDADNNGAIDSPNYLPSHALKFKFKINDGKNDGSVEYEVRLYADANADGRFAESTTVGGTTDPGEVILEKHSVRADGNYISINKPLSGMLGSIPWKLEVYSKANKEIRYSVTGLSAIRRAEGEKQRIRVLQIKQNSTSTFAKNNLDISSDPKFLKYISRLNDYKLEISAITISEFEKLYDDGNKFVTSSAITTDKLVNNYDMLIFGFSDYYANVSNVNGALDNLKYFIDYGKSVLFTHDVTSFNNLAPENSNISGVNFNLYFRGLLSMDRFGIRKDKETGANTTYERLRLPNQSEEYWVKHGFTVGGVIREADPYMSGYNKTPYNYRLNEGPELTTKARALNEGQITSYPYEVGNDISIAQTHGQYYQLQMEDKDVVVWYCLAPNSAGSRGSSMYGLMPNDASNNYYIYNKGNITYSGVGHSTVNGDEEVKLLVNTMIAAYNAGFQPPAVEILNVEAMKNSVTDYFYFLNVDHATGDILANPIENIRFKVEDANLIFDDMAVWVAFDSQPGVCFPIYKENPDGSLTEVTDRMPNRDGTKTNCVKLKAGEVYVFQYDTANMTDTTKRKVIITAENQKGLASDTSITFMNRLLFNLD